MSKPLYMKPFPAFAAIEFNSVPAGIFAADALLKKSPIAMIRSGTIGEGRYLILLAGTTASVEEAHVEALFQGGLQIADDCLLPDIHPRFITPFSATCATWATAPSGCWKPHGFLQHPSHRARPQRRPR